MGLNRKTDPTLLDAGLTKKGKSQASSIPALMDVGDVDIVVISPLTRAFHTAILAFGNSTDVPVILNYDIREIGSGLPENRGRATRTVLRELSVGEDLIGRLSGVREDWPDAEEGGGGRGNKAERIRGAMKEIAGLEAGTIAVVCHHNVIQSILGPVVKPKNATPILCEIDVNGVVRVKE